MKVKEDWRAPVHRNRAEYEWLRVAARIAPGSAVQLFGSSEHLHGFAMEYLQGSDVYLWKAALLEEREDRSEAGRVGNLLGQIHAISTQPGFDTAPFHNREDFRALRIEPYLTFTAGRHPEVADELVALAEMLFESGQVLVHGDISPKNILFRNGQPVILDAECATMGDASFDASFCINHLILKAAHLPASRQRLLSGVVEFWNAYSAHIVWEPKNKLEERICGLVPALMLARIDGKSPVEYLSAAEQDRIRGLALGFVKAPTPTLRDFTRELTNRMEGVDA
nr:aminoglycoside phosphotransferase family protein [Hoeflea prorocentri]